MSKPVPSALRHLGVQLSSVPVPVQFRSAGIAVPVRICGARIAVRVRAVSGARCKRVFQSLVVSIRVPIHAFNMGREACDVVDKNFA